MQLKNGGPSHDTFERVFAMLEPKELEAIFGVRIGETVKLIRGETVSIYGKHCAAAWTGRAMRFG